MDDTHDPEINSDRASSESDAQSDADEDGLLVETRRAQLALRKKSSERHFKSLMEKCTCLEKCDFTGAQTIGYSFGMIN